MSKRNQEKRKTKRAEKARLFRKGKNARPVDLVSDRDPIECWSSYNDGIESILTFRRVKGGETVGANFLIDYDCIGLKDAYFRVGVTRADMDAAMKHPEMPEISFRRIPLEDVRRRVAGAMRWTREHPFKLPVDGQTCAKLIGLSDGTAEADISEFGQEDGSLFYIGGRKDLIQRLKGITLEDLMASPDFGWDFLDMATGEVLDEDEDAYDEEEEDGDVDAELDALANVLCERMLAGVRQWCFANGRVAEAGLPEAIGFLLRGTTHATVNEDEMEDDAAVAEASKRSFLALMAVESSEEQESIERGARQLQEFMEQFKTQEELFNSLGMAGE